MSPIDLDLDTTEINGETHYEIPVRDESPSYAKILVTPGECRNCGAAIARLIFRAGEGVQNGECHRCRSGDFRPGVTPTMSEDESDQADPHDDQIDGEISPEEAVRRFCR